MGYMTDTSSNPTPSAYQKFVPKVLLRPVPVTPPNWSKLDLSIMSFKNRHFVPQCFKDLHSKEGKNEQY